MKRILTLLAFVTLTAQAKPLKVFILAGQSNMEGQAVVDLKGKDYNDGKGTLAALMADPTKAATFAHLKGTDGQWTVRDDVVVHYQREDRPLLAGPLALGFSVYGDAHHFGPELQFGHIVGDHFENPVLLIKAAWGGKSLYRDFRPPSSGGEVGKYYKLMIAQVREKLVNIGDHEIAGFVWYQGWNDGVNPQTAVPEYEQNLVNLIHDVRRDLHAPKLPVVIGELTGAWVQAPPEWEKLRAAQAAAAKRPAFAGNVAFVPTRDFVRQAEDSPNPSHGHHEFGHAETYFLVGDALGKGMLSLVTGDLHLTSPIDYEVIQRRSKNSGHITIAGKSSGNIIEAQIDTKSDWKRLDAVFEDGRFYATLDAPTGGWYRIRVRASKDGQVIGETSVAHVGIGEVFVVAGQSNSANHGQEKQATMTGHVASFDGQRWQLANDPQRGASGKGGSFMPPLGDALAQKFGVPIGFIPCGIGATSVREWLPKGAAFPNPPSIESRVQKRADGTWESKGQAYEAFVARLKQAGNNGFRAVLWHQGESDANQKDTTRTLVGKLYRDYLERVIRDSRREIGWEAPWFVAQASYHVPGDESSPDIRTAQGSLWKDGIALEGPDSDALKGALRERNGLGVHFSGPGLREHAAKWAEKIVPWLEQQLR